MLSRRTVLVLAALLPVVSACRFFRPVSPAGTTPAKTTRPTPAPATQPTAQPAGQRTSTRVQNVSDANIAAMVLASNNTDLSYARLVPSRAERSDIKEFAKRMLTDHTSVNGLVTELLTKLDLAAEDNELSLDMRDESATKRDLMRDLSGYKFDSTYIENEVSYHRKFLESIDQVMLPAARNQQLRGLLTAVRPAVAAHLAHAEQVRADVIAKK